MDWSISLSIAIILMLLLFLAGVPVFVTFIIINSLGVLWLLGSSGFGLFANSIYQTVTNGSLAAVPLFVLMGEILFRSGTIETLIDSVDKLVGKFRGRDYVLVISLSTIFGALCGSTTAVAALLGKTMTRTMNDRGYDTKLTTGIMIGGASLAAIIPPSALVVILGSLVDVSIASLLIAGILPGIVLAILMVGYLYIRILLNPRLEPDLSSHARVKFSLSEKLLAVIRIMPFSLVIFSVVGLIMLGIATPSESAATGVVGAIIAAAIYKKISLRMLVESFLSTVCISAMILIIMVSAQLFGQLLSFVGASSGMMKSLSQLNFSNGWMFLILMAVPFVACMFIDIFAVMFVSIPVYMPLIAHYKFDPIWFWMLFIINLTLGSMTPPFGYTLFALKGATDTDLNDIFISAWPMVFIYVLGMIFMYYTPTIITILPRLF
ncbi:MAG: TRAP transporter large permease subunit [Pseudomonadota bacterium]